MSTLKINKHKIINMVGLASSGVFAGLALVTLCPAQIEGASAEGEASGGASARLVVANNPMIAVGLSTNTLDYNFTPTTHAGELQEVPVTLNIRTNNADGYTIYMESSNAKLSNGRGDTIASITTNTDTEHFPSNQWGYSLDAGSYGAVPAANTVIKTVPGKIETEVDQNYTLNFGVKVGTGLPAGTYTGDVIVSAIANPIEITSITQLTSMQDVNLSEVCKTTLGTDGNPVTIGNEPSVQLQDARDQKWYWVSKLADGNCWMTQNLDLDIPAAPDEDFISKSDNIPAGWKPTEATRTNNYFNVNNSETNSYSWDVGDYRMNNSTDITSCSLDTGASFSTQCANRVTPTSSILGTTSVPDTIKNNEEIHYHLGNYYQFLAATAGTGTADTGNASGSICPKGWTLPKIDSKSYANLFVDTYHAVNGQVGAVDILTSKPLYFPRTGVVAPNVSQLVVFGSHGLYWIGTGYSNTYGYKLEFNGDTVVGPTGGHNRFMGYPIRCVVE